MLAGFRLLGSGFLITALDFDITQVDLAHFLDLVHLVDSNYRRTVLTNMFAFDN